MKLKFCKICKSYTLKENHCKEKTSQAGYKYLKIKTTFPVSLQG